MTIISPFDLATLDNPDKSLVTLDKLINTYNKKPSLNNLQLIDAQANQLRRDYIDSPKPHSNKFLRWLARDPITPEIYNFSKGNLTSTNERIFEILAKPPAQPINFQQWTKDLKTFKYKEKDKMDFIFKQALLKAEIGKTFLETHDTSNNTNKYLKSLKELRTLTLTAINSDPQSKHTVKKFSKLVDELNFAINQIIMNQNLHQDKEYLRPIAPIPELQELVKSPELSPFVIQLKNEEAFSLGDFQFNSIGGNNNKNWIAKNDETAERYIVRLEKILPQELLVEKIERSPEIKQYIANDYFLYPTPIIKDGAGFRNEYNIALSEFCPKKDLLSFRYSLIGEPLDFITDKVLAMTVQVANFANALHKKNMAYSDIKAENFLLRDNEEVVTADKKSIVNQDLNRHVTLNGPGSVAISFRVPEQMEVSSDAEAFMAYEIGVMLYVLMTGDKDNKPFGTASYKNNSTACIEPFTYEHAIFETKKGNQVRSMIEQLVDRNPANRPSLTALVQTCQQLILELKIPVLDAGSLDSMSSAP